MCPINRLLGELVDLITFKPSNRRRIVSGFWLNRSLLEPSSLGPRAAVRSLTPVPFIIYYVAFRRAGVSQPLKGWTLSRHPKEVETAAATARLLLFRMRWWQWSAARLPESPTSRFQIEYKLASQVRVSRNIGELLRVSACLCVCKARGRERERATQRQKERERVVRACVRERKSCA